MQSIEAQFKRLGIDRRSFRQGEIYIVKDKDVQIPDSKFTKTGRVFHENRPVVIVYDHLYNSEPTYPLVVVAPLSHDTTRKRVCDLELFAARDGVDQDCLLRLGLIQPLCKVDLEGPAGRLDATTIDKMLALLVHLLGVSLNDEDRGAVDLDNADEGNEA
ncbi:MAG: type II toxin-antitoxin system PemK/MazF family toxin [Ignavibacteriales bacterium]